jgi:hypothetical protein
MGARYLPNESGYGNEEGYGTYTVYSDMIVRNCTIHDCGRRSISLHLYAHDFTVNNILVENCTFYHGTHTTGVDFSVCSPSYNASMNNVTVRNCVTWDEPNWAYISTQQFTQNQSYKDGMNGTLSNVYIYNNIFKYPTNGSVQFEDVNGIFIYNNTFYGHNTVNKGNTFFIFPSYSSNVNVKNNVFYTDLNFDTGSSGMAISLYSGEPQSTTQMHVDYNTYYRINNNLQIIGSGTKSYYMNSQAALVSDLGWETHGKFVNPNLTSATDYHLQTSSPVIHAGVSTGVYATDKDGVAWSNPPSMGCYEFGGVTPPADNTAPVVTAFVIPSTASLLTVPITTFTATDNVGVTGYQLTETSTKPTSWSTTVPTSYTFANAGTKTLYAWAKDAVGNVSASVSKSVVVTIAPPVDNTAPVVTAFVIPSTATSLTVPITTFTATDNVGVTGYQLTEISTKPTTWSTTAPTSYTFTTAGTKTLYAWVCDLANNTTNVNKSVVITIAPPADVTPPTVTTFTIPSTSISLTVSITTFTATDNVGVTGYQLTETSTKPITWSTTAPTSYTFATAGTKTLYAWAKDAAGNISTSVSKSIVITLAPPVDNTAPVVTAFVIPATSTTLKVSITTFTATDNVGVTGYLLTETSTISTTGWVTTVPTSYTFTTAGTKTLYAWAKDAAGNVSTSISKSVVITIPPVDVTAPVITAFVIPSTSTLLTISITTFTATDNVGVTGYALTETNTKPTTWSITAPINYTFSSTGTKTLYAWVKDAAGNTTNVSKSVVIQSTGTVPTVTTNSISSITTKSAVSGGNVTNEGGSSVTVRGICWSKSSNPTTSNSTAVDGTGTGTFSSSMTGLSWWSTYYVRAYATNSSGTSYGANVQFKTKFWWW